MTTKDAPAETDGGNTQLAEHILKGDSGQAAKSAKELSNHKEDVKDVVDTISDTMNIVADLHEVERYSADQVVNCERAAEKALEAIKPKIRVEQTRISGRVMVTSMRGDPHSFDRTLLLTMLEIGGFTPLDGGVDLLPEEVASRVSQQNPDILAVPLVTTDAAKYLIEATSLINHRRPELQIVAFGKGTADLSPSAGLMSIEENSLSALSRIAEILMTKP